MKEVEIFTYVFDDKTSITVMNSQVRKGDILELEKLHGKMIGFDYDTVYVKEKDKDGE